MRRHARDARDRSDLIESGQDYKRKTIYHAHAYALLLYVELHYLELFQRRSDLITCTALII